MPDSIEVELVGADDGGVSAGSLSASIEEVDVLCLADVLQYVDAQWAEGRPFALHATSPSGGPSHLLLRQEDYTAYIHSIPSRCAQLFACESDATTFGLAYDDALPQAPPQTLPPPPPPPPHPHPLQLQPASTEDVLLEASGPYPFAAPCVSGATRHAADLVGHEVWLTEEGRCDIAVYAAPDVVRPGGLGGPPPSPSRVRHVATPHQPTAILYVPAGAKPPRSRDTPSGPYVWVGYATGVVEAIDPNALQNRVTLKACATRITALCYNGASAVLASAEDGMLCAFTARPPQLSRVCGSHDSAIRCLTATPRMIVSGDASGRLRVWDGTGGAWCEAEGHAGSVADLERSAGGATVWSCGVDATLRTWDVVRCPSREPKATTVHRGRHSGPIMSLLRVGSSLYASSLDGSVSVYSVKDSTFVAKVPTPQPVVSLKLFSFTVTRTLWGFGAPHDEAGLPAIGSVVPLLTLPEELHPSTEDFKAFLWDGGFDFADVGRLRSSSVSERGELPAAQPVANGQPCPVCPEVSARLKEAVAREQEASAAAQSAEGQLKRVEEQRQQAEASCQALRAEADAQRVSAEAQCSAAEHSKLVSMEAAARKALQREREQTQRLQRDLAELQEAHSAQEGLVLKLQAEAAAREQQQLVVRDSPETEGERAARRALQREAETQEAHQKASAFLHLELERVRSEHAAEVAALQAQGAGASQLLEASVADLQACVLEEQQRAAKLESELSESSAVRSQLADELEELRKEVAEAQVSHQELQNEHRASQSLLETTASSNQDLKRVLALKQSTIDQLHDEMDGSAADVDRRLQRQHASHEDELRSLREQHARALANHTVEDVAEARLCLDQQRLEMAALQQCHAEAEAELASLQQYADSLEGHLQDINTKLVRDSGLSEASVQRVRRYRDSKQLQQELLLDMGLLQHEEALQVARLGAAEAALRCGIALAFISEQQRFVNDSAVEANMLRLEALQWKRQAESPSPGREEPEPHTQRLQQRVAALEEQLQAERQATAAAQDALHQAGERTPHAEEEMQQHEAAARRVREQLNTELREQRAFAEENLLRERHSAAEAHRTVEQDNADLREKRIRAEEEAHRERMAAAEAQRTVEQLTSQLRDQRTRAERAEEEARAMRNVSPVPSQLEMEESENAIRRLREALASAEGSLTRHQGQLRAAEEEVSATRHAVAQAEAQALASQQEATRHRFDAEEAVRQVTVLQDRLRQSEEEAAASDKARRSLERVSAEHEEAAAVLKRRVDSLEHENADGARQLRELREDHLDEVAKVKREASRTVSDMDASLAVETKRLRTAQDELAAAEAQLQAMSGHKQKLLDVESAAQAELLSLRSELSAKAAELAAASQAVAVMESERDGLAAATERLKADEGKAAERLAALRAATADAESQAAGLRQKLTVNTAETHALRQSLEASRVASEAAEERLQETVTDLRTSLRAAEADATVMKKQVADNAAAVDSLKASLREGDSRAAELTHTLSQERARAEDTGAELDRTKRQLAAALSETEDSDSRRQKVVSDLRAALSEADSSLAERQRALSATALELEAAKRELRGAQQVAREAEEREAALTDALRVQAREADQQLSSLRKDLHQRDEELEHERLQHRTALASTEVESSATAQAAKSQVQSLTETVEAQRAELGRCREQLADMQVEMDAAESSLRATKQELSDACAENDRQRKQLDYTRSDTSESEAKHDKMLQSLRQELCDTESERDTAAAQIRQLRDKLMRTESDVEDLRHVSSLTKSELLRAESSLSSARQELTDVTAEADRAKRQLATALNDTQDTDAQRQATMDEFRRELSQAEDELASRQKLLAAASAQVEELLLERRSHEEQISQLEATLQKAEAQEVASRVVLANAHQDLDDMECQGNEEREELQSTINDLQAQLDRSHSSSPDSRRLFALEAESEAAEMALQQRDDYIKQLNASLKEATQRAESVGESAPAPAPAPNTNQELEEALEALRVAEQRCRVLEGEVSALEAGLGRDAQARIAQSDARAEAAEVQAEAMRHELQEAVKSAAKLESRGVETATRAGGEAEALAEDLAATRERLKRSEKRASEVQEQHDEVAATLRQLEGRCCHLADEVQELQEERQGYKRDLEEVEADAQLRVDQADAEVEALQQQLHQAMQSAARLKSQGAETATRAGELEAVSAEKVLLNQQVSSLRQRLERAEQRADEAQRQNEADAAALREAERRAAEAEMQQRLAKEELDEAEQRAAEAQGKAAASASRAAQAQEEACAAREQRDEADAARKKVLLEVAELEAAFETQADELEQTKREALRAVSGSPRGALEAAQGRAHAAEERAAAAAHEAAEARQETASLAQQLQDTQEKAEAAQAQMASAAADTATREAEVQRKAREAMERATAAEMAALDSMQALRAQLDEQKARTQRAEASELRVCEELAAVQSDAGAHAEELRRQLEAAHESACSARAQAHDMLCKDSEAAEQAVADLRSELDDAREQAAVAEERADTLERERFDMASKWQEGIAAAETLHAERVELQKREFNNTLKMAQMDVEKVRIQREHTERDLQEARADAQKLRGRLRDSVQRARSQAAEDKKEAELQLELDEVRRSERACRREIQALSEELLGIGEAYRTSQREVHELRKLLSEGRSELQRLHDQVPSQPPTATNTTASSASSSPPPPPTPEDTCSDVDIRPSDLPTSPVVRQLHMPPHPTAVEESRQEDYMPSEEEQTASIHTQLHMAHQALQDMLKEKAALEQALLARDSEETFEISELRAALGALEEQLRKTRTTEEGLAEANAHLQECLREREAVVLRLEGDMPGLQRAVYESEMQAKAHRGHMETCEAERQRRADIQQELEMRLGDELNLRRAMEGDMKALRAALETYGAPHPQPSDTLRRQHARTRGEEEQEFILKTRPELVQALWSLFTDIVKVQKPVQSLLAAGKPRRGAAEAGCDMQAVRSLQGKLKAIRVAGTGLVSNYLTPLEKLHCGAATSRFRPDEAILQQFAAVFTAAHPPGQELPPPPPPPLPRSATAGSTLAGKGQRGMPPSPLPPAAVSPAPPTTVTRPLFERKEISPTRVDAAEQQKGDAAAPLHRGSAVDVQGDALSTPPTVLDKLSIKAEIAQLESKLANMTRHRSPTAGAGPATPAVAAAQERVQQEHRSLSSPLYPRSAKAGAQRKAKGATAAPLPQQQQQQQGGVAVRQQRTAFLPITPVRPHDNRPTVESLLEKEGRPVRSASAGAAHRGTSFPPRRALGNRENKHISPVIPAEDELAALRSVREYDTFMSPPPLRKR